MKIDKLKVLNAATKDIDRDVESFTRIIKKARHPDLEKSVQNDEFVQANQKPRIKLRNATKRQWKQTRILHKKA